MKIKILFLCIGMMLPVLVAQANESEPDELFYGNTANVTENQFGTGYVAGTNNYGDTGKYQRFDFTDDVTIVGAKLYFGVLTQVGGSWDEIGVVVRKVASGGAPGDVLHSQVINLGDLSIGQDGNSVSFDVAVGIDSETGRSIFIGIEWTDAVNDEFALYLDSDGEGNQANRAWERFDDFSFNDFGNTLNPSFSWLLDADIWIGALYNSGTTSIDRDDERVNLFSLAQNYPNPFNPTTSITFTLGEHSHTRLEVFNMVGQSVATLVDGEMPQGSHSVNFNAENLPSGVYIYRLTAGSFSDTKKLTLVK